MRDLEQQVISGFTHIVYIHTCIHTCIHACMHASVHQCIHTHIHTCMHMYMAWVWRGMHVCMNACTHVGMYASMYACMYACVYVRLCMYACAHVSQVFATTPSTVRPRSCNSSILKCKPFILEVSQPCDLKMRARTTYTVLNRPFGDDSLLACKGVEL